MTTIKPSKYLVAVDDTDVSRMAVRFACIKAKKRGILIDILHVIPPNELQAMGSVAEKARNEQYDHAQELLTSVAQEAYHVSGLRPSLWIAEGEPASAILDLAISDPDINMIVLGLNPVSKSGNKVINWVTGKAGDKLLIPVMLVPATLTDQQMEELG